jgi:ribbon-helix-helix CopG family protein
MVEKVRVNIYLLRRHLDRLDKEKERTGSSVSEILRKLIDETYPEVEPAKKKVKK